MLYTFKKSKTNIGLKIKKTLWGQKRALQQVILHTKNAKNDESGKAVGRCLALRKRNCVQNLIQRLHLVIPT